MVIMNTKEDERWRKWHDSDPISSWMGVPMVIEGEAIGVLTVDSFTAHKYMATDLAVLQLFANHAAAAIRNARLYSWVQGVNQQLAKSNADKDKFFSIVAHDLRGPFLPLLGNLELMTEMTEDLTPQDVLEMSAAAHRSARRVYELLENLLHWARLQMGRMEYQPEQLALHDLTQQTVHVLSEVAESKGIRLLNEVPSEVMVFADSNMLDTVIRNLTNNALKFTSKGGQVTISTQLRIRNYELGIESEESLIPNSQFVIPNYIEVSIADTGVGMSEIMRQKLFKIDEHITTMGTGKETGTGLGLIICQEMVVKSGGRIWVESELGVGTTVRFTVPLA